MKILPILLLIPFYCASQSDSSESKLVGDTLITQCGYKVIDDQKIKIGKGSMPDGDFRFIRRNSGSLFNYYSTKGYQGLANQANALPRGDAGFEYKVVRIEKRGTKKHGFVYYPIINVGMIRFEVDIDNAIEAGEIYVPEEFRPKPKPLVVEVKQSISVADEIAKLKKLYDDGVLTKEEFEAQKKKLLDKN
jgi:hypothetical protein